MKSAFHQFYKGVFQWKFPGSAQNTVFQNMCNTGTVSRWRPKNNVKYFILVLICQKHHSCSAFFMTQQIPVGMDVFDSFFL